MDYKRVLKLHFENGYSGRTIAKNTGEGQRTAINEFLKRFKECEELNWPLSEEVTNEYIEALLYKKRENILFIDDFGISRYSEDGIKILYHLLKSRADLHYPTVFNTQYEPSEWGKRLSDDPECFGKLDGIRRRLTTGFTVEIVKL